MASVDHIDVCVVNACSSLLWFLSFSNTFSHRYVDYLEALGRVADMVLIPTQKQLNLVGADTIVEFYTLLDSTGLWESFDANNVARRDESRLMLWDGMRERVYDDRPLHVKLRQFLLLVASMKQRKSRGAIENRCALFFAGDQTCCLSPLSPL